MKKLNLLFTTLLLMCYVGNAKAVEVTIDGIKYDVITKAKQATVISGDTEYSGNIVIPSEITYNNATYSVTSIGNSAFAWCDGLTSITIPNSVTSIGNQAFEHCTGLTSITIPNSVTSIGSWAFSYCYGLTSITIGNSVTSIGDQAFYGCSSLTSVTIGNSVTSIGDCAFEGCSGLTSITIPNSVTSIGGSAFSYCSGLTSITIPNSVTSIGDQAFRECSGLTSITIPNSVTSIGFWAFYNCKGLTSVTIPNSVTSIENEAFRNCSNLTDVYCLATDVPTTGSDAFKESYPEYMKLHVPAEAINSYKATAPWSSFGSIVEIFAGGEMVIDGIKYDINVNTKQATVIRGGNYAGDIVIPSEITYNNVTYSVTSIGTAAFEYCDGLTSITIPNSVTSIGNGAFSDCSGLTSIIIPNSVTSIGRYAFSGCSGLTSITIGNSVTSIGNSAFRSCSGLTSITIPNSVTSIGEQAFNYCSNLTDVYCLATNVPATNSHAFGSYPEDMTLHVPAEAINSYKATEPWSSFGSIVEIFAGGEMVIDGIKYDINVNTKQATVIRGGNYSGDIVIPSEITYDNVAYSVTSIGESAFYGCSELTSIVISDGVKHIGKYAFENCTSLTSADIPNSVTSIGNWAFGNCSSLTNITIPYGVTSIGTNTFGYCSSLKSIELPNSVKNISVQAFYDCTALENITIPNSVTSIGSAAFFGTVWYNNQPKGLVYAGKVLYEYKGTYSYMDPSPVVIEEGTLGIAERAFMNQSIKSITIPNSIINIGDDAFYGCYGLTDVYCLATNVPATKSGAFDSSYIKNMKLHVPAEAIDSYKTTAPWSSFGTIVTLNGGTVVTPKCKKPVIKYNNGEIEIECETADAEFVTAVTNNYTGNYYSNNFALTATYNISVYATAEGYDNSDTVNATLCWIECDCSADDNTDIINIPAKAVFVTSNNGTINISCSLEGEVVELYTIDAMYIGSTTIENGTATIESGLSKGDIAIIKIAEKSIKVILN